MQVPKGSDDSVNCFLHRVNTKVTGSLHTRHVRIWKWFTTCKGQLNFREPSQIILYLIKQMEPLQIYIVIPAQGSRVSGRTMKRTVSRNSETPHP